jgi:hypothetical protein
MNQFAYKIALAHWVFLALRKALL